MTGGSGGWTIVVLVQIQPYCFLIVQNRRIHRLPVDNDLAGCRTDLDHATAVDSLTVNCDFHAFKEPRDMEIYPATKGVTPPVIEGHHHSSIIEPDGITDFTKIGDRIIDGDFFSRTDPLGRNC